jgi:hypothetical protein
MMLARPDRSSHHQRSCKFMPLWKQIAAILLSTTAVFVVPELFGFKLTSEHFQWIAFIGLWMSSNLLWSRQPTTWKKKFLDAFFWLAGAGQPSKKKDSPRVSLPADLAIQQHSSTDPPDSAALLDTLWPFVS